MFDFRDSTLYAAAHKESQKDKSGKQIRRRAALRALADFHMSLSVSGHGMLDFYQFEAIVAKGYQAAQAQVALWESDERFCALRDRWSPGAQADA